MGTVDYMAPEQAHDSRATSIQSDIYSLGCTFYYLLTGVPAYPGGDITDKLTRHARAPVPDVLDLRRYFTGYLDNHPENDGQETGGAICVLRRPDRRPRRDPSRGRRKWGRHRTCSPGG